MGNIGERLREERERLGTNQTDFGALAGVTKKTQMNYETGKRHPDAAYLQLIAEKGVDVLYVVTGQHVGDRDEVREALALYADCWTELEAALARSKKTLSVDKKRAAVDALFDLVKQGSGEVAPLAVGLVKVAA